MRPRSSSPGVPGAVFLLVLAACGGGADLRPDVAATGDGAPAMGDGAAAPGDRGGAAGDDASVVCVFEGERRHTVSADRNHVADNTGVQYGSNPPSSGPHCSSTAPYRTYDQPLDSCRWLHNLEHGAVVLLYNCPAGCADIVAGLQRAMTEAARDPDCATKRIIVSPYPLLDSKVAAAAWGFTWKSPCLDDVARASLVKFIGDHLGSKGIAPEALVCG